MQCAKAEERQAKLAGDPVGSVTRPHAEISLPELAVGCPSRHGAQ